MSYWMVKPEAFQISVNTRRDAINESVSKSAAELKPQRSVGSSSVSGVLAGKDSLPDKDTVLKQSEPANPDANNDSITDTALSPRSPFILLSNEDKNKFWWEIAKAATRQRGDNIVFNLDTKTANKLARRFNCTPLQLMEFFRDGADAKWLQPNPDDK